MIEYKTTTGRLSCSSPNMANLPRSQPHRVMADVWYQQNCVNCRQDVSAHLQGRCLFGATTLLVQGFDKKNYTKRMKIRSRSWYCGACGKEHRSRKPVPELLPCKRCNAPHYFGPMSLELQRLAYDEYRRYQGLPVPP